MKNLECVERFMCQLHVVGCKLDKIGGGRDIDRGRGEGKKAYIIDCNGLRLPVLCVGNTVFDDLGRKHALVLKYTVKLSYPMA